MIPVPFMAWGFISFKEISEMKIKGESTNNGIVSGAEDFKEGGCRLCHRI